VLTILLVISLPLVHAAELRLTYDANGNLVTGDGKYRVYNSLNQLSKIYNGTSTSDPLLEEYTYHPLEERILMKKIYSGGSLQETTVYISRTFVQVINSSGTYNYTYIYHEGQLVAQSVNGVKLFIHGNHEGSSSVVTNASGGVVERTEYSPFGEQLNQSVVRYGYEGKEYSSTVGDTDFNFRKYNPEWGLFTQPDDIIQNIYDPQALNRYSFERNNPYKYTDPTGHTYGSGGPYSPEGEFEPWVWWKALEKREDARDWSATQLEKDLRREYYDSLDYSSTITCKGCKSRVPPSFEELQERDLLKNFDVQIADSGKVNGYVYKQEQVTMNVMLDNGFTKSVVQKTVEGKYTEKTGNTYKTYNVKATIMNLGGKLMAVFIKPKSPSITSTNSKSSKNTKK